MVKVVSLLWSNSFCLLIQSGLSERKSTLGFTLRISGNSGGKRSLVGHDGSGHQNKWTWENGSVKMRGKLVGDLDRRSKVTGWEHMLYIPTSKIDSFPLPNCHDFLNGLSRQWAKTMGNKWPRHIHKFFSSLVLGLERMGRDSRN